MSFRFHPERNIFLCGLPASGINQIGRTVAQRVRRPLIDLQAEVERRSGVAMRWPWQPKAPNADNQLMLAVDRSLLRSSQVLVLTCTDPLPPGLFMLIKERCYLVFIDKPLDYLLELLPREVEADSPDTGNGVAESWARICRQLKDCDLYLGPDALPQPLYTRLIIHCFYS